jgi:hypothetical protein
MNAKHRRNSWSFPICFSVSLLLLLGSATEPSKRHSLCNLEGTLPQTRLLSLAVHHTPLASHPKPDQNLRFDPVLVYSTYLGGAFSANYPFDMLQVATVIPTDAAGNLYVAGSTNSRSFPVTPSVVEPNNSQKNSLGFLQARFHWPIFNLLHSPRDTRLPAIQEIAARSSVEDPIFDPVLVYSTFLGGTSVGLAGAQGSNTNFPQGVTASFVDSSGNLYIAGATSAADFPVTTGVVQPTNPQNNQVGFLSKLDPTGQTLLFSTYLYGMGSVASIAQDSAGNIYVAGIAPEANPSPLPIPTGSTPFNATPRPISVVKLNNTATMVLSATYLGGSGTDLVTGLAADASDNVYISGTTTSNDFPTENPLQGSLGSRGQSLFVTKLNPTLSSLLYSTYLGQSSMISSTGPLLGIRPHGLAVDAAGDTYVVGQATSGFPTTSGAYQPTCSSNCAFLAKLNPAGSSLLYATYLGNGGANAVAVDSSQNAYIGGAASSEGFPEVNSLQSCGTPGSGIESGFVSEINATGALTFSTCLGQGSGAAAVVDLALGGSGNVNVIGAGAVTQLPLQNPIQSNPSTSSLFVAAIAPQTPSLFFSSFIEAGQLSSPNVPSSVAVDGNGNIFASGFSGTFGGAIPLIPIYNALQPAPALANPNFPCVRCEATDGFIMKIAPTNVAAAAVVPGALAFQSAVPVGTSSSPAAVTVVNMGSAALTVSEVALTNANDFSSMQNGCSTVAPAGGTCSIQVTFTPSAAGTRNGVLLIYDSSAGSPRMVQLSGQTPQNAILFNPTSISFSPFVNVQGSGQTQLKNGGSLPIQISNIQITSSAFSETNNCGTSVAPSSSCLITISLTPTSSATVTGNLVVTDSAPDSPQTIPITAAPQPDQVSVQLDPSDFGYQKVAITAGQSFQYPLWLTGEGVTGTATLGCSGLPIGASCSFQPPSANIPATGYVTDGLTLTTTARSFLWFVPYGVVLWILVLIVLCGFLLFAAGSRYRKLGWAFVPLLAIILGACGGGSSGGGGTPVGTYNFTVNATLGSTKGSLPLTLVIN